MTADLELVVSRRVDPEEFARAQDDRFRGHQLRIGRSRVVHAVAFRAWLGDLALPVPACHQGWSGFAAAGDLIAVTDPVTCRKCATRTGTSTLAVPEQTALFGLDRP